MVAARSMDGFTSLADDGKPTDLSSLRSYRPCLLEPAERVENMHSKRNCRITYNEFHYGGHSYSARSTHDSYSAHRYSYLPRVLAAFEQLGYEIEYSWANPHLFTLSWARQSV